MDRMPPPDLPNDPVDVMPIFTSRRKAALLPPLRPVPRSNALDDGWCRTLARADWHAGFRWGVTATVGGLCVVLTVIVRLAQ